MPRVARIVISGNEHHVTQRCPHIAGSDFSGILDLAAWRVPLAEWRQRLQQRDDKDFLAAIRNRTCTGRPLVSDSTLSKLEALLNKRLRPLLVGRPRKEEPPDAKGDPAGKAKRGKGQI